MPKLFIKTGERKGFVLRLNDRQKLTIGRDPANALVLPDRRVSRMHACISPEGQEFLIEDLKSVNGTQVNGQHVVRQPLKFGDEIVVGSTILQFLSLDAVEDFETGKDKTDIRILPEGQASGLTIEKRFVPSQPMGSFENILEISDPESLKRAYQKLMILYRITNDLGTIVDLKKLLGRIMDFVIGIITADQGFMMLKDRETGDLEVKVVKGKEKGQNPQVVISQTIIRQVMESGESILTTDAMQDERFNKAQSIVLQGIRSTMCVPIKFESSVLGVIQVDTIGKTVAFTQADLELLTAVSRQAAVAIQNAKLFEDLKRAHGDLKAQQAQLIEAEKLSALGKLASGVAHEINNPLTSILGYSQLAFKELSQGALSAEKLKECAEFAKIIEGESLRCEQIVQDLLQFSRRRKNVMAPTDVNQIVDAALKIARFHLKRAPIEIKKELQDSLPVITADGNQLQQVFLNLIINAKDAMDQGGTLTIATRLQEGRWVEAAFTDTGCGIPADQLEDIFKPLFTTKGEKGTGLGLAISQDIVERHHGMIDVNSTVGQGTTFRIKLPIENPAKGDSKE